MKKRILSIILAIAMLFSLCVPTAYAADVKMANYSTTAGVCMLSWSDAEAMDYSVTVYNASTGAVAWSGTTSYNYLYARMIGLVSGTTYYYTVTASGSTTPAQSAEFTYDSSLETVEVIVAGATYDYYNDKLTWNSSGAIAQFKVEVYSADDNTLVRTLYTTNNYVSGDEAFQDTGNYYYKVRIVDASGNNVGDTNYWYYCPSDSTYGFNATVKVTFDACAGYFDGDETKKQITLKVDRNTCKVEAFPFDNVFMYGEVINGYYTELGYQIYEDHEFYEDTILYAHYDDCDHTTSTTSATCEEDAICSVCGMTLSAKGHNYAGGVCVNCGEAEPSEDEGSTSVTVSDSENTEILPQVIDTNTVGSATISIDTTGSAAAGSTGTLTLSSVASTVSSLTFDGSTTGSSITLTPETSANITIGETLTGKETTTSGDETNLSGTVLFYGDLSYSSLNVSGATLTLSLAVTGTVDPDSVVLLHNGTSGWERLDSSTVTNNGTLTITGTLTGLSPIMVLTVEADEPTVDYGTVTVNGVALSDGVYFGGYFPVEGTPDPDSSYAYYKGGVLYLNDFVGNTVSTTGDLTISLSGTNTLTTSNSPYGIYADGDITISGSGKLDVVADYDYENELVIAVFSENGNITISGTTVTAKATNDAKWGYAYAITPLYDLTIENSTVTATATADGDEGDANALYSAYGDVSITASTVNATASANGTTEYTSAEAIYAGNNMTIASNSSVTATATSVRTSNAIYAVGALTINSSTKVEATATATGTDGWAVAIETWSGNVDITSTPVTATATANGENGDALGLYVGAELNISQSTVTAITTANTTSGYSSAISADDYLTISKGTITAKATGAKAYAIEAYNNVTIENDSTVNATAAGTNAYAVYAYCDVSVTASDVIADGGILAYNDYGDVYGTITLTPGTNKTLEVTLGTNAMATSSYSAATSIVGSAWTGYSYISIIQADAGGTSHTHSYTSQVTTAATCTDNGVMTYTCSCGDSYTETIPATGHDYDNGICTICGAEEPQTHTHTYGEPVVENAVAATCTEDGSYDLVVYCLVCSEELSKETITVAATGHSYEAVVTAPTCTEGGYTTYTCTTCGDDYTADETEALGHHVEGDCIYFDWDYGNVTVTVLCSDCGTVLYSGDADQVTSEYTDPTCTANGFTTYTATYYNDISYQTYQSTQVITDAGSATGHTWDEGTVNINATCDTPGSITYTCKVCGETYTEEIPATGHSYEAVVTAPTCTEKGYTTYTCSVCGDSYIADETEATGHSYTESYEWSSDFTSCTVTLTCKNCDEVVEYVSATDDKVTITEVDGLFTVTLIHDGVTYSTSVQTYTVTWVDGDGNEIQVDSRLLEGATVSYSGSTPTKASDNTYSYTFAGWDNTVEPVSGNTTYTAKFTASAHNYVATFSWADNLKSASVTLTCSDCDHTVTIDSSDVTIKAVNNLGLVTRTATAEFNGVTYTDSVTTGVSLLVIPADYTSVNLAIARANGLDSSNYANFADVTTAINAVRWNLNVLNQATVNAYAEAINTAIDNLKAIETVLVEETVEIDEPIEGTDTDTEPDDVNVGDNTEAEPDTNPTTGIALALLPMALAMTGAALGKKK